MITNIVLERHEQQSLKEGNSIKISAAGSAPILLSFETTGAGRRASSENNSDNSGDDRQTIKEAILGTLRTKDGQTTKELIASTGLKGKKIYDKIYELRKIGVLKKIGNTWTIANGNNGHSINGKTDSLTQGEKVMEAIGRNPNMSAKGILDKCDFSGRYYLFAKLQLKGLIKRSGSGWVVTDRKKEN